MEDSCIQNKSEWLHLKVLIALYGDVGLVWIK